MNLDKASMKVYKGPTLQDKIKLMKIKWLPKELCYCSEILTQNFFLVRKQKLMYKNPNFIKVECLSHQKKPTHSRLELQGGKRGVG